MHNYLKHTKLIHELKVDKKKKGWFLELKMKTLILYVAEPFCFFFEGGGVVCFRATSSSVQGYFWL